MGVNTYLVTGGSAPDPPPHGCGGPQLLGEPRIDLESLPLFAPAQIELEVEKYRKAHPRNPIFLAGFGGVTGGRDDDMVLEQVRVAVLPTKWGESWAGKDLRGNWAGKDIPLDHCDSLATIQIFLRHQLCSISSEPITGRPARADLRIKSILEYWRAPLKERANELVLRAKKELFLPVCPTIPLYGGTARPTGSEAEVVDDLDLETLLRDFLQRLEAAKAAKGQAARQNFKNIATAATFAFAELESLSVINAPLLLVALLHSLNNAQREQLLLVDGRGGGSRDLQKELPVLEVHHVGVGMGTSMVCSGGGSSGDDRTEVISSAEDGRADVVETSEAGISSKTETGSNGSLASSTKNERIFIEAGHLLLDACHRWCQIRQRHGRWSKFLRDRNFRFSEKLVGSVRAHFDSGACFDSDEFTSRPAESWQGLLALLARESFSSTVEALRASYCFDEEQELDGGRRCPQQEPHTSLKLIAKCVRLLIGTPSHFCPTMSAFTLGRKLPTEAASEGAFTVFVTDSLLPALGLHLGNFLRDDKKYAALLRLARAAAQKSLSVRGASAAKVGASSEEPEEDGGASLRTELAGLLEFVELFADNETRHRDFVRTKQICAPATGGGPWRGDAAGRRRGGGHQKDCATRTTSSAAVMISSGTSSDPCRSSTVAARSASTARALPDSCLELPVGVRVHFGDVENNELLLAAPEFLALDAEWGESNGGGAALVQLATANHVWLLDCLDPADLRVLKTLFQNAQTTGRPKFIGFGLATDLERISVAVGGGMDVVEDQGGKTTPRGLNVPERIL